MSRGPLVILADDLTGAAEIAAIAHQRGLRAVVVNGTALPRTKPDVLVLNTDTRLSSPAAAARVVRSAAMRLAKLPRALFFKKTDSVLRGPVLAELTACAAAFRRWRVLLVPSNPSLARVIRDGEYFIEEVPLHRTAFARDPHHPCKTAKVVSLLNPNSQQRVTSVPLSARMPVAGVMIGEAATAREIAQWASRVDAHTLPAGGADFFRAWLKTLELDRSRRDAPTKFASSPTLLLSGTTIQTGASAALPLRPLKFREAQAPAIAAIATQLRQRRFAAVAAAVGRSRSPRASLVISRGFARMAVQLHREHAFQHLAIVGGATAGAVLRALGWTNLEVVRTWGPGVVTLRPLAAPASLVTLKPGSYDWPAAFVRETFPSARKS
jgi:uncharacterized protein YgbK (DUF1537 family)